MKEVDDFIELNSQTIDNIALAHLSPARPVIPLKILVTELRVSLRKDLESQEIESLRDLDEEQLSAYVTALIQSLESYVYTKNRVDLYHKEGTGLAVALDQEELDSEQYLSLYYPDVNSDGVSKSSRTQSAEEYLKQQNVKTINRQNLYGKLFKTFEEATALQQVRERSQDKEVSASGGSSSEEKKTPSEAHRGEVEASSEGKSKLAANLSDPPADQNSESNLD